MFRILSKRLSKKYTTKLSKKDRKKQIINIKKSK